MRMKLGSFLALLGLLFVISVESSRLSLQQVKSIGWVPHRTSFLDRDDHVIRVIIGLKHKNVEKAVDLLFNEIANPKSNKFTQHLSHQQIKELMGPSDETVDLVMQYLISFGVPESQIATVMNGDELFVNMPIGLANKMFNIELKPFISLATNKIRFRSLEDYTIPAQIAEYVDMVHGLVDFPVQNMKKFIKQNIDNAQNVTLTKNAVLFDKIESRGGAPASVTFKVVCADGQFANKKSGSTNGLNVCQSQSSSVLSKIAVATQAYTNFPKGPNTSTFNISLSSSTCQPNNDTGLIICNINVDIPYYTPTYIGISLYFGSTKGPDTWNEYPSVKTPALVTQSLQQLYNIPPGERVTNLNATQCVVEFEQQYYSATDLALFLSAMGVEQAKVTVIGYNDVSNPGVEANLDIQWIMGLAPGSPTTLWSIYANSTVEIDDILQWEYAIANTTNPPIVNSLSYGMTEDNVNKYLGPGYLQRSDQEFIQLALLGISVIIADGDAGSIDLGAPPMSQDKCFPLHADWPSQSPFVTAVSSTFITPYSEPVCYPNKYKVGNGVDCSQNPLREVSVSIDAGLFWTTGGGFSNFTAQPSYQKTVVDAYLNGGTPLPPSNYFNRSGRGYPDVATVGHNLMIVYEGQFMAVDGTSASAPIWAAVLTLLNNARLNVGKRHLGFVNPLLYTAIHERPSCFNDIVVGHNACGDYDWRPWCCPYGFLAAPDWDAISGLGSPNYLELRDYVLSLP